MMVVIKTLSSANPMLHKPLFFNRLSVDRSTFRAKCRREYQRGVTLIELLVGITLALIASLVMTQVFSLSEGYKRSTTGGSDATQSAAILSHYLTIRLEEAGNGLVRGYNIWGCEIHLSEQAGETVTDILPPATSLEAPFTAFTDFHAAPVLVAANEEASDGLMIMAADSSAGARDLPVQPQSDSGVNSLIMVNSNGIQPSDYVLVLPRESDPGSSTCKILQVAEDFDPGTAVVSEFDAALSLLPKSTDQVVLSAKHGTVDESVAGLSPYVMHLGARPTLVLMAVNASGQLIQQEFIPEANVSVVAENVYAIKFAYGLDNLDAQGNAVAVGGSQVGDGVVDDWVLPTQSGWNYADLSAGTEESAIKINQIKAIRVGLVMRSVQPTALVTTESIQLFCALAAPGEDGCTGGEVVRLNIPEDGQRYQYFVHEWVVPIKNQQFIRVVN